MLHLQKSYTFTVDSFTDFCTLLCSFDSVNNYIHTILFFGTNTKFCILFFLECRTKNSVAAVAAFISARKCKESNISINFVSKYKIKILLYLILKGRRKYVSIVFIKAWFQSCCVFLSFAHFRFCCYIFANICAVAYSNAEWYKIPYSCACKIVSLYRWMVRSIVGS